MPIATAGQDETAATRTRTSAPCRRRAGASDDSQSAMSACSTVCRSLPLGGCTVVPGRFEGVQTLELPRREFTRAGDADRRREVETGLRDEKPLVGALPASSAGSERRSIGEAHLGRRRVTWTQTAEPRPWSAGVAPLRVVSWAHVR